MKGGADVFVVLLFAVSVSEDPGDPGDCRSDQGCRFRFAEEQDRGVRDLATTENSGLVQERDVVPSRTLCGLFGKLHRELLPGDSDGLRAEVIQRRVWARLRGPIVGSMPYDALQFGVPCEFRLARPDPDPGNALEGHGGIACRADLEEHHPAPRMGHDRGFDADAGGKERREPREEVLVLHGLLCVGIEGGAHDLAGDVVDAENEVGRALVPHAGRIGKRRHILAEIFGRDMVQLPLDPFRLGGQRGEPVDEGDRFPFRHDALLRQASEGAVVAKNATTAPRPNSWTLKIDLECLEIIDLWRSKSWPIWSSESQTVSWISSTATGTWPEAPS